MVTIKKKCRGTQRLSTLRSNNIDGVGNLEQGIRKILDLMIYEAIGASHIYATCLYKLVQLVCTIRFV